MTDPTQYPPPAPTFPSPAMPPEPKRSHTLTVVIIAVTAVLIAGIIATAVILTSKSDQAPGSTGHAAPVATSNSKEVNEEAFYRTVNERGLFSASPRADVIELGHTACTYLRTSKDIDSTISILADSTTTYADAEYFVGAAVAALCPDLSYLTAGH